MARFRFEISIDAPLERVWDVIADFGSVYRYSPAVTHSYVTSGQRAGVGTTRHCDLVFPGATIEERIIDWHADERYTLEIFDGDRQPPFRTAHAGFEVHRDGPERSVVTAELAYELKFGPAGALMDRLIVEPKFGPAFGSLLAGLKHHIETGEEVTADTDLSAERAALRTGDAVAA